MFDVLPALEVFGRVSLGTTGVVWLGARLGTGRLEPSVGSMEVIPRRSGPDPTIRYDAQQC